MIKNIKVQIIHTTPITIDILKPLFKKHLPNVLVNNLVDESLLNETREAGRVTKSVLRRMCMYFAISEEIGAKLILNACSSVGEAVDLGKNLIDIPIVKIDQAAVEKAIEKGARIGVLGTVRTTLEPTTRLVKNTANEIGKEVEVDQYLCEEAFDLLSKGKGNEHDKLLLSRIKENAEGKDVIILAQASMSRLVSNLPEKYSDKVLTTPKLGVLYVKKLLEGVDNDAK